MSNFTREELACNCGCGQDTIDYELMAILEDVRIWYGVPVTVTSGNRCTKYNKEVGGGKKSQHLLGRAADITVQGRTPKEVATYIQRIHNPGGLGRYATFTHVDTRVKKARWGKN